MRYDYSDGGDVIRIILVGAIAAGAVWGQNLLCNSSFELPQITGDYAITDVPCWQTSGTQKIEVQRKSLGVVTNVIGTQYVELDNASNSDIYQDFATVPGQRYLVRLWIANRAPSTRSQFNIYWDGALLGTASRTENSFVRAAAEVVATKTVSRIGLAAGGTSDGYGDLVDEVTVVPIPAAGSRAGYTYYLPHYAHGGGWASSILVVNTSPTGFFSTTVEKTQFNDAGVEVGARQTVTLDPAGSTVLETTPPAELQTGWVRLVSTEPLETAIIFRNIVPGRFDLEATVPAREATTATTAPFDNAAFTTGFAAANPSSTPVTLTFAFRETNGLIFSTVTLPIGPYGHTAFAFGDKFPQTAGKKGSVLISATDAAGNPAQFVPLGLRFTAGGAFTTLPY